MFAFLICLVYIDSAAPVHFHASRHSSWRLGPVPYTFTSCTFMSSVTAYYFQEMDSFLDCTYGQGRLDGYMITSPPRSSFFSYPTRHEFISLLFHSYASRIWFGPKPSVSFSAFSSAQLPSSIAVKQAKLSNAFPERIHENRLLPTSRSIRHYPWKAAQLTIGRTHPITTPFRYRSSNALDSEKSPARLPLWLRALQLPESWFTTLAK